MSNQNQKPAPKKKPKGESPTSSTKDDESPETLEDKIRNLSSSLGDLGRQFEELTAMARDDLRFVPAEIRPGDEDLVMMFDIRLFDGDGELMRLKGRQDFPMALSDSQASSVLRKFQQVFTATVLEPIAARLQQRVLASARKGEAEERATVPFSLPAPPEEDFENDGPDTPGGKGGFIAPPI